MLLTTFDPFAPARGARLQPAVRMDAIRREHDVQLRFDLPGIDPDSIDVTVERGGQQVTLSVDLGVRPDSVG